MPFSGRRIATLSLLATVALPTLIAAPTLTGVSPSGGRRGTAVRLALNGNGLDGEMLVRSRIPGTITELTTDGTERLYLLEIDSDAEPGAYPLAVETSAGRSNPWLFSVSGLPETFETEPERPRALRNDLASRAQPIEAPIIVNGSLDAADRDLYRIRLRSGQSIIFEVEARRLGSAIDPVLAIRSPESRTLARRDDSPGIGSDCRIAFVAPVAGDYLIEVHDARFSRQRRNFYRLVAGPTEYAETIFPLGWTAGEPVEVELSGGTLEQPVRVVTDEGLVAVPGARTGLPIPLLRSSGPETLEPIRPHERKLSEGTIVNGRIAIEGEVDRYRLAVQRGEEWMIETQAAILGTSELYTLLVLRDQDGRKLASAGDQTPEEPLSNISSRAETYGDPSLGIVIPDGVTELELSIEDLLGRGGPGYGYRLVARRQTPDFILRMDDTHVNIPRSGSTSVSLTMERRGYDGPVRIMAEGLPADVVADGGNIPAEFGGMTTRRTSLTGRLSLTASEVAKPANARISFYGEGRSKDGRVFRRTALTSSLVTPVAGAKQRPVRLPGDGPSIPASVVEPIPASIELASARNLRLIQGLQHDIKWIYKTHENGVEALSPVRLLNAPAVGNLRILGGAGIKPGDKTGVFELNTTMGTPAMRFDLVLEAQIRHAGTVHTVHSPAIIVDIVQGYRVEAPTGPSAARPGASLEIAGSFSRDPAFDAEVSIEAANLPVGVSCGPQRIAGDADSYSLRCDVAPDTAPGEYVVEITPRSVLAGRDKEAVPYNIPPVEAVLVIQPGGTMAETPAPEQVGFQ